MSSRVVLIALLSVVPGCILPAAEHDRIPLLEIETYEDEDRIVFTMVEAGLDWPDIILRVIDCGPDGDDEAVVLHAGSWSPYYNQAAARSGLALNDPEHNGFCAPGIDRRFDGQPTQRLTGGDYIEICASNEQGAHDVGISVIHAKTGHEYDVAFFSQRVRTC